MLVPLLCLLVSMVCVQYGAALGRALFDTAGAYGTVALRVAFACVMLVGALRPWRGGLPRAAVRPLLAYGATLGVMNLLFYLSLRTLPLGIAVALEFMGPMALTLAEARRVTDLVWVAVLATGLWLLLPLGGGPHGVALGGAALALAAGGCWAIYIVQGQRVGAALGTRAAALGMVIAAILVVPAGAVVAGPRLLVPGVLWRGAVVALFSSALPYTLEMVALPKLSRRLFGTLMGFEPAVAAIMGAVMLRQALSVGQMGGIACVMVAAMGTALTAPSASVAAAAGLHE